MLARLLEKNIRQICMRTDTDPYPSPLSSIYDLSEYRIRVEDLTVLQRVMRSNGTESPWRVLAPAVKTFGAGSPSRSQWYVRPKGLYGRVGKFPFQLDMIAGPGYGWLVKGVKEYEKTEGMMVFEGCGFTTLNGHSLTLTQVHPKTWLQHPADSPPLQVEYYGLHEYIDCSSSSSSDSEDTVPTLHQVNYDFVFKLNHHPRMPTLSPLQAHEGGGRKRGRGSSTTPEEFVPKKRDPMNPFTGPMRR
ncbi:uncharacterized protein JCM6883_004219 [Sporobolomyces salmoneus]|uniref:uncharacterized protein n=1 Tax=Sporobolomyces salmoneus TaxID=183962 RepID=UPI003174EFCE